MSLCENIFSGIVVSVLVRIASNIRRIAFPRKRTDYEIRFGCAPLGRTRISVVNTGVSPFVVASVTVVADRVERIDCASVRIDPGCVHDFQCSQFVDDAGKVVVDIVADV